MANTAIPLTVRSRNGSNVTAYTEVFVVDKMSGIVAITNGAVAKSATIATGDTGTYYDAAAKIYVDTLAQEIPSTLYWTTTALATGAPNTIQLSVYRDSNRQYLIARGSNSITSSAANQTVVANAYNGSGISFSFNTTSSVSTTTENGTLTVVASYTTTGLNLNGNTEFGYSQRDGVLDMVTVTETVAQINVLINGSAGDYQIYHTLTVAEITTGYASPVSFVSAPAAGYVWEVVDAIASYDYDTAAYSVNTDLDIVTTTTKTRLWTAATAISGSADKITRFVPVAGVTDSAEGLSVMVKTGNPTVGAGAAGTCKVTITYKLVAI